MYKRRAWSAGAVLLLLILTVHADLRAQRSIESGPFVLSGQIISQRGDFQDAFKVQLYRESLIPLAENTVRPQERIIFAGLSGGVYYVVAEVPGFKKIRERFDVNGYRSTVFSIFLEEQRQVVVAKPPELDGGEELIVHAADLETPPELVDELQEVESDFISGDVEVAQERLQEIVTEQPDFYDAHMSLGAVYQTTRRYRDAEAEFRKAADLRSELSAPWTRLGSLYLQEARERGTQYTAVFRGILNEAVGSLLQATERNPNASFAHYLLGVAYFEAGFYEDAEESLMRSIQLEPQLKTAHLALANVYIKMREWPAAITQLDSYLEGNTDTSALCDAHEIRAQIATILNAEKQEASALPSPASLPVVDADCRQTSSLYPPDPQ